MNRLFFATLSFALLAAGAQAKEVTITVSDLLGAESIVAFRDSKTGEQITRFTNPTYAGYALPFIRNDSTNESEFCKRFNAELVGAIADKVEEEKGVRVIDFVTKSVRSSYYPIVEINCRSL